MVIMYHHSCLVGTKNRVQGRVDGQLGKSCGQLRENGLPNVEFNGGWLGYQRSSSVEGV